MYIVIISFPVDDVINFENKLSFLIKPFSYLTKKAAKKNKEQKEPVSWNKKNSSSFL